MKRGEGTNQEQILRALQLVGPMGTTEMARYLSRTNTSVNDSIRRLRRDERVHIVRYDHQPDGTRGRMIPIYAEGGGGDAEYPGATDASTRNKKYRARHSKLISIRRYHKLREKVGMWAGLL